MQTLVIGGSGFIGIHVVDALLARGARVRVTRRKSTLTILLRKRPVELVHASLDDAASLESAMEGCEAVFLSGAHYPRYSTDLATSLARGISHVRNACTAARHAGIRRLIYTSSVAALGAAGPGAVASESNFGSPDPAEGVYPTVKKAMEQEIDRARESGLDVTSILAGGCIGPLDFRLGTNGLLVALLRGALPFRIDGTVNVADVRDVAAAHVACLDANGSRYCAAGHDVRFGTLLSRVAARYGTTVNVQTISIDEARSRADAAEHDAERRRERVPFPRELVDLVAIGQPVSNAKAEHELRVSFRPLDASIDETVAWLARHRFIPPTTRSTEHAV